MRSAVRNVAKYFPTAIISGRSCDKVYGIILFMKVLARYSFQSFYNWFLLSFFLSGL